MKVAGDKEEARKNRRGRTGEEDDEVQQATKAKRRLNARAVSV